MQLLTLCIFAALCFALVSAQTFDVGVAYMTSSDPQYNNPLRISSGYTINGLQGPALVLTAGTKYTFTITSTCAHPFYITNDPNGGGPDFVMGGAGTGAFTPGTSTGISVVAANGTTLPNVATSYLQACAGAVVEFTPPVSTVGQTHYYQCGYHIGMGWQLQIVAQTFCQKYAAAFNFTELALMEAVIGSIFMSLHQNVILADFFDGAAANYTVPQCCLIDFFTNAAQATRLGTLLTAFFGGFLGCNSPGFPTYNGSTNLQAIHELMPIGTLEFNTFNTLVINVIVGFGVNYTDLIPLYTFLNSTKEQICNGPDCRTSFCDRYADLLKLPSYTLVNSVVDGAVGLITALDSPIRHYFNCTPTFSGCVNLLSPANAASLATLEAHLTQFFGQRGILGCTSLYSNGTGIFPAYQGITNLSAIHQPMGISVSDFDFFNQAIINVLAAAGVTANDQAFVLGILDSTQSLIVSTTLAGAPPPAPSVTFNFVTANKNSSQPNFNTGYPVGFYANPAVVMSYGNLYQFNYPGTCAHPLYLTTDPAGAGNAEFSTSITSSDYSLVCGQGSVFFNVLIDSLFCSALNGSKLYYNCRIHESMGGPVTITGCPSTAPPAVTTSSSPPSSATNSGTATTSGTPTTTSGTTGTTPTSGNPPPSPVPTSGSLLTLASVSMMLFALLVLIV